MFCPNCGTQLAAGVNFCPNCGTKVAAVTTVKTAENDNRVMLVSLGDCARATASALLQQICGYSAEEALLILDNVPIVIARSLNDNQARYLAQALAEYGLEVSVYDGNGWRDWEGDDGSVWDKAGDLVTTVAAALGLINVGNRISRDMIRRMDYPYRFNGTRPPVYRLHTTMRAVPPRRVAPVRPPVHRAPPPRPVAPVRPAAPQPPRPVAPVRPAAPQPPRTPVAPVRPAAPQPPRPVAPVRPAAPQPARPAAPQRPAMPGHPGNLPGGNGGRSGGAGRQGGPGRPGR